MSARYAVYFAPGVGSPWWNFGAHWLGRNEEDSAPLPQPACAAFSPEALAALTATPRRYGFHATLKAPFRLAPGHGALALRARMQALAKTLAPVHLAPLRAAFLDGYVALLPAPAASKALQTLGATCVEQLDDLRAPPQDEEIARRKLAGLDPRESELLERYGYPYVMERFRLHLTLTGAVDAATAEQVIDAVAPAVERLNAQSPLVLDRLCLFMEPGEGRPFQRIADAELGA